MLPYVLALIAPLAVLGRQILDPCGEWKQRGITCGYGQECRLVEVICVTAPCPPLPTCVPKRLRVSQCDYGDPVLGADLRPLWCSAERSCPDNTTCNTEVQDTQTTCCWTPQTKPGTCPNTIGHFGTCVEECSGDACCPGTQKCCSNGCGHTCQDPVKPAKPGTCPKPGPVAHCAVLCSGDASCPGTKKCCSNGCGTDCTEPVTSVKTSGKGYPLCPAGYSFPAVCDQLCWSDSDCPFYEFCCRSGCFITCVTRPKPGNCPRRKFEVGPCYADCENDYNCPKDQKCCGKCPRICERPC